MVLQPSLETQRSLETPTEFQLEGFSDDEDEERLLNNTNSPNACPADWGGVSPDHVIARLKLMKADVCEQHGLRPFFKSYNNWDQMTMEQRNKTLPWFRKLPDHLKGIFCFICSLHFFILTMINHYIFCLLITAALILQTARFQAEQAAQESSASNNQTTKDDIARLIHLFKEPGAQMHWSNHYGVLNRAQLDARRTAGPQSDAANPLSCLAEMFNDYNEFQPQNLMIKYVHDDATGAPKKKNPWEPSHDDWAELSTQTYDIDPTKNYEEKHSS
jgi:hypothetical protein